MKKTLLILALILLATASFGQRRYYHETDNAVLRVDEQYPGAFVEHRYLATGADNLYKAFLALGDGDSLFAWGSAHDYAPLRSGSFILTDSLSVQEFWETFIEEDSLGMPSDTDSVLIRTETTLGFEDTVFGVSVIQKVVARTDSNQMIIATFQIKNERATTITGLRVVFFYDGDVPDYLYIDDYPEEFAYLQAVGVRDGETNVTSGFCGLIPSSGMICGALRDWVDSLVTPDSTQMLSLIFDDPTWPVGDAYRAGDWASYGVWRFPDMPAGAVETLSVAFIVDGTAEAFGQRAATVRGDTVVPHVSVREVPERLSLSISPNPFNAAVTIAIETGVARHASPACVEIFDISGRLVRSFRAIKPRGDIIWDGRDTSGAELPSGVYLIALKT
ncbi:MAG TPA: T9SS type A sorting domain-containing protein, partial [candidate division Zixibacteria bacterium]|nr:T9SS type A sorting domain-containing protein [candidate division Zixibacteria bacterium]